MNHGCLSADSIVVVGFLVTHYLWLGARQHQRCELWIKRDRVVFVWCCWLSHLSETKFSYSLILSWQGTEALPKRRNFYLENVVFQLWYLQMAVCVKCECVFWVVSLSCQEKQYVKYKISYPETSQCHYLNVSHALLDFLLRLNVFNLSSWGQRFCVMCLFRVWIVCLLNDVLP